MEQGDHQLLLPLVEEENICLPLPINVVSRYWNIELPMAEAVESAKKYSDFNGSIMIEGIELAERHGLSSKIVHSSLTELKKIIDAGIPPIVILPGIPEITQHASVITGYNEEEKTILHYIQKGNQEGEQQEGAIPQDVFDREWSEEGRLLIIMAPSDTLSGIVPENNSQDKSNRLCFNSEKLNILKNTNEAIIALKQAIELDSNNSTALHLYASMLNQQNSLDCVSFYERSLKINNKSYLTFNGLGNFYLKTNQFEKAENSYSKAIEINPKRSAKIYKNRAYLLEKQNKNSDAKEDLKSYLKYFPKAPDRGIIEQAIREI
ncbi:MAG: tetratricopeptide repeat protein [Nitrosopumilus sp.]|jgi:tetratricopeptide (TPR) repeat protein|nr:tetratricopeptide repeat protein [Nitrosopumilus sp.]MBT3685453.1 tetratricopeptide repeat protein [Nitrosopumilus sp.]MBT3924735.1 tetratricopeptide repeat protein [Nitrosopumilus sp.]MBT4550877.1 tetratricopeptide repeat protein [Nitrosopumilus sp.]MBT7473522.1 tetratricopeptide repeat protein [Nitrosopumilus sp.]